MSFLRFKVIIQKVPTMIILQDKHAGSKITALDAYKDSLCIILVWNQVGSLRGSCWATKLVTYLAYSRVERSDLLKLNCVFIEAFISEKSTRCLGGHDEFLGVARRELAHVWSNPSITHFLIGLGQD